MTVQNVRIVIDGDSSGAVAAARQVSNALNGMQGSATSSATATVAAGVAIGDVLSKVAEKAYEVAQNVITAFDNAGNSIYQMQLAMGGSAEELSKVKFVTDSVGVSVDAVVRAWYFLTNHLVENDKAAQQLGISYKDLNGKSNEQIEILARLADRYKSVTDVVERSNMIRDALGRGVQGADSIVKVLNLGGDAIREMAKQAEKFGVVLSQDDLRKVQEMDMHWNRAKISFQGAADSLGRALQPAMIAVADAMSKVMGWITRFINGWDKHNGMVKAGAIVVGVLAAALGLFVVVEGAATAAAWAFSAAIDANPISLAVMAVVALGAGLIALVKNFDWVGQGIIAISTAFGWLAGHGIWLAASGIKMFGDIAIKAIDMVLAGVALLDDTLGSTWLDILFPMAGFLTMAIPDVSSARAQLANFKLAFDSTLHRIGDSAKENGAKYGSIFGTALVEAIKNLHMPTFDELFPPQDKTYGPPWTPSQHVTGSGKAGGAKVDKKKEILDFFTSLVNAARDALNAARQAAIDARDKMKKMGEDIAKTMADALDITALSESSFAKYLGVGALMKSMRKKLAEMKEFAADIKKLAAMGLPQEMLIQIANAGVSGGGLDTARMLLANPDAFKELQDIQSQINAETAAAGAAIATVVVQPQVTAAEKAAAAQQSQFLNYLATAQQIGYVATADDLSAGRANVHNEVTINTDYFASPEQIAAAVAWALQTGTALGMKPAGLTPISGKTKKKKK